MKLTIHRGTNQIGGSVIEIESEGYRVFIDFGKQLPGTVSWELGPIYGLTYGDVSKSALFISHYHEDHIGMINETVAELPIYIGKTAIEIYKVYQEKLTHFPNNEVAKLHVDILKRVESINTFEAKDVIKVGGITVTPLFTDHSAFDAYMFVIEAENIRVLYTGDFRAHGFRSKGVKALSIFAQNIDYIISEGTNINRQGITNQTERQLQLEFKHRFRKNKKNFVFVSSTNIDRIFSIYHAAKDAGLCFVCDAYQAKIMETVSQNHKQYSSFYNIDYDQVEYSRGRFFKLCKKDQGVFSFEGNLKPYLERHGFCMLIRQNENYKPLLDKYARSGDGRVYYSMWKGYLDKDKTAFNKSLYDFLEPYKIEYMHTSGHADVEALKEVFDIVKPKVGIIPIHTEYPEKFKKMFPKYQIIMLRDGNEFNL